MGRPRKINSSTVFAGEHVGVKQVSERIGLASFIDYDLGFFDDETSRLEPAVNPFEAKVLPMQGGQCETRISRPLSGCTGRAFMG